MAPGWVFGHQLKEFCWACCCDLCCCSGPLDDDVNTVIQPLELQNLRASGAPHPRPSSATSAIASLPANIQQAAPHSTQTGSRSAQPGGHWSGSSSTTLVETQRPHERRITDPITGRRFRHSVSISRRPAGSTSSQRRTSLPVIQPTRVVASTQAGPSNQSTTETGSSTSSLRRVQFSTQSIEIIPDTPTQPDSSTESSEAGSSVTVAPRTTTRVAPPAPPPSNEPPAPSSPVSPFKYGKRQEDGAQRRRWIERLSEPCPIPRNTLTFEQLAHAFTFRQPILSRYMDIPLFQAAAEVGVAGSYHSEAPLSFRIWAIDCANEFRWRGRVGPGVMLLEDIERPRQSHAPHMSQISLALYSRDYPVETLKYVFVSTVINIHTISLIQDQLYTARNNLDWPWKMSIDLGPQYTVAWEDGTEEYDALLGTKIGKLVAYIVLGAFPRGTRRIARIVTWPTDARGGANIRFDIEENVETA